MKRDFEPFSAGVDAKVIPTGRWQRIGGIILIVLGLFPALAATPLNGAGAVASVCFGIGGGLLFWGVLLRYLSALEEKLGLLIVGLELTSPTDEEPS